ncbi:MAG TPA: GyrI-like domain-containing protein [Phnomibacter sp.]|nr:GyrI-like domain-containing protein [Phnomibacter sp.]
MQPLITTLTDTLIVGRHLTMSLAKDRTTELWQGFAPRAKEIGNRVNKDRISLKVFSIAPNHPAFSTNTPFEKWAAVQVSDLAAVPDDLDTFTIPQGQYAVFVHKGSPATFGQTLNYIFSDWLPVSDYELDNRPHFEIMGEGYRLDDPNAEETIWVPVKQKLFTELA